MLAHADDLTFLLSSSKSGSPDIYSYGEMKNDWSRWEPGWEKEKAGLLRRGVLQPVPIDDPSIAGIPLIETTAAGRCKRDEHGLKIEDRFRLVIRGDTILNKDANRSHSPAVRNGSSRTVEALGVLRRMDDDAFDVNQAFGQGMWPLGSEKVIIRYPKLMREVDHRGTYLLSTTRSYGTTIHICIHILGTIGTIRVPY